jgi:hypothetical protein
MNQLALIKLNYPPKTEVELSEVVIEFLGESNKVPCSEMPDDFWDRLPKPLSRKPFQMEVTEEDLVAYLDYLPEYRIIDTKGLWTCIEQLQSDPRLSSFSAQQIESGFRRYWEDDERPEYVYYSKESAIEAANNMIEDFVKDSLGDDEETIYPRDEIAMKVATETNLEVVLQPERWAFPRYIDGGEGIGFRIK